MHRHISCRKPGIVVLLAASTLIGPCAQAAPIDEVTGAAAHSASVLLPHATAMQSGTVTHSGGVGGLGSDPATGGLDRAGRFLSDSVSPLALVGGAFLMLDSHHHHGEARSAFEGMAVTGMETVFLKKSINETRPHGGGGSFPSGHESLAFSLATALSEYHPHYKWFAYGTAAAIGAARVQVDAHYWHDVVAGAGLGYFTTKYFMHHHNRGIIVTPGGVGVQKQF